MQCSVKIERAGVSTTYQDQGRTFVQYLGIVEGGSIDRANSKICNAILQNRENESLIEFAYQGPKFSITQGSCKIAIAGDIVFKIYKKNNIKISGVSYRSYFLESGDIVDIVSVSNSVYGYLGFEGGIQLEDYFGSVSANYKSGIGQNRGSKIMEGDSFVLKKRDASRTEHELLRVPKKIGKNKIRVLEGPQSDYFSKKGLEDFFQSEFAISNLTDKMGMRLKGPKIEHSKSPNIKSEGIAKGSIQIPADGQPIVLLSDHQTIGGYPKIAVVISADFDDLVQIPPGQIIKFRKVNIREAEISYDLKNKTINNIISTIKKIN